MLMKQPGALYDGTGNQQEVIVHVWSSVVQLGRMWVSNA